MGQIAPSRRGRRRRRSSAFRPRDVRLMLWGGMLAGLLAYQMPQLPIPSGWSSAIQTGGGESAVTGAVTVIDGDTFIHHGERIRIADIDTPEVNGRCPEETALAAKATRRVGALLAEGPFELHLLSSGRDRDRYGRQLRIVMRDGQSLGDVLVAERLARTWSGRREPWCG